ncbi:hypothetical protein FDUTEX481_00107 [Tolypothrix sp. PCC 7601]|nr:hypothetical protein FDUTEX481_00107 [Tolypothrix sp. PCC 7601]
MGLGAKGMTKFSVSRFAPKITSAPASDKGNFGAIPVASDGNEGLGVILIELYINRR